MVKFVQDVIQVSFYLGEIIGHAGIIKFGGACPGHHAKTMPVQRFAFTTVTAQEMGGIEMAFHGYFIHA